MFDFYIVIYEFFDVFHFFLKTRTWKISKNQSWNIEIKENSSKYTSLVGPNNDIVLFPFGWGELWGVADRTDYDLTQHINTSGKALEYFDPQTNEKYIPYVIEPSLGVERLFLAIMVEAYDEEQLDEKDSRVVLHFHPALAPFKAAVLPLSKKLSEKADEVYTMLSKNFMTDFDDAGSIGKRYRRQDEIGTPFCITYDFDSLEDGCVTVRNRDTMAQERVAIDKLVEYINQKIAFWFKVRSVWNSETTKKMSSSNW